MANKPKPCWNLNESNVTIFIDSCQGNSFWESLPGLYAKSSDSLLTHWLPMTNILFLTDAIYSNIFRCYYLTNEKFYSEFSAAFSKLRLYFEHFENKRWPSWLMHFSAYGLRKTWLDKCLKSLVSEGPWKSNMVNGPKPCWSINDSTFTILIYHCERNSVGKSLS